jgi:VCPO second helical-bundle domain
VKALGGDGVTTPSARTPEQTQIGFFWIESSPLAWNRIARTVSASSGLELWENARLFGLLNLSLADGYIASWEAKYHYNYWRPVTAIQTADSDGNPDTVPDPTWTPLQLTYPMPDHDSAHSVQGGAAAETLRQFLGTDDITFSACSLTLPAGERCTDATPVFRTYTSFSQAAEENGVSRILIGIHFRRAVDEGLQHGRQIAQRAFNLLLRPVH